MLIPCEVAVKTVSPAIRALLAKQLMEKYQMTETETAKTLGLSQSAISKYSKNIRGATIPIGNLPEIQTIVAQMAALLTSKKAEQKAISRLFCQACNLIRSKSLMCPFCMQNQKIQSDNCDICMDSSFFKTY